MSAHRIDPTAWNATNRSAIGPARASPPYPTSPSRRHRDMRSYWAPSSRHSRPDRSIPLSRAGNYRRSRLKRTMSQPIDTHALVPTKYVQSIVEHRHRSTRAPFVHRRDWSPFIVRRTVTFARIQRRTAIVTAARVQEALGKHARRRNFTDEQAETDLQSSDSHATPRCGHRCHCAPSIVFDVVSFDSIETCRIVQPADSIERTAEAAHSNTAPDRRRERSSPRAARANERTARCAWAREAPIGWFVDRTLRHYSDARFHHGRRWHRRARLRHTRPHAVDAWSSPRCRTTGRAVGRNTPPRKANVRPAARESLPIDVPI